MSYVAYFDNFYPDGELVRKIALDGEYEPVQRCFTGLEFRCPGFPMVLVYERAATLTRIPLHYDSRRPAVFRALTEEQDRRKIKQVHIDRMGLACVICLSENKGPDPYTSFYRHKTTGLTGIGDRRAVWRAAAAAGVRPKTLLRRLDADGADLDRWVRESEIPYRFNRLIVFDSNLFHVAGGGAGDSRETAKLTQNFNCWPLRTLRPDRRILFGSALHPLGNGPLTT